MKSSDTNHDITYEWEYASWHYLNSCQHAMTIDHKHADNELYLEKG